MERRATLALLSNPTFLSLWIASNISNLGGLIQAVGAGWLMTSLATSNDMVALVQSSTNLTLIVFPLQAGALADNFDRRQIMIWAQVIMLAISAVLAGLTYLGMMTPWLLLIFTLALGSSGALYNPSWQASVRDIVPRDDLPGAIGLNSMGFNLMSSVGPALSGLIVAFAGTAAAYGVNALTYIALIVALVL